MKKSAATGPAVPMSILGHRRSVLRALLGIAALVLLALAIRAALAGAFRSYPLETLIGVTAVTVTAICIALYMGELVVLGWVVDLLSEIGMPKSRAKPIPLEYEQVGEIIVVTLRDNVVTLRQCQMVQKQLQRLIDDHHCDFVLDFFYAEKISISFRGVMVRLVKAARREAEKLGKPYRAVALPPGAVFKVFADRQSAVAEMFRHDGHGWVVLCRVPVGVRAVSDLG